MSGNANSLILSALIAKLRKTLAGSSSALDGKRRTLISFEEGLETLPQRIVRSLIRTHIHCNAEVSEILPEKARDGTTLYRLRVLDSQAATLKEYGPFRHILLTLPAAASSRLLEGLSGSLSKKISDIPHASIGVTHLSVAKANCSNPLEGFGMLLPPRLSKGLLGVVFSSSVFPGRAPEDRHLLTCFSGGAHFPEMARVDKNTTLNDIVAEVSNSLSLSSSPEVLSSRFLPKAIPNYSLRHGELEEEAQRFSETYPNLHLVSSWRSGIGVPERIRQANALVQQIVAEDLLS